ncbi:MAG: hypothetical protein ACK4NF_07230 [Planctomycetota bacterium]
MLKYPYRTYTYNELGLDPGILEEIVLTIKRCAKVTAGWMM